MSLDLSSPPLPLLDPDAQGCAHLLVEHEQVLGAFAFRGEAPAAVEPIHGAVERPMGLFQAGRRQIGVVQVRQRRVRKGRARVEDRLRQ